MKHAQPFDQLKSKAIIYAAKKEIISLKSNSSKKHAHYPKHKLKYTHFHYNSYRLYYTPLLMPSKDTGIHTYLIIFSVSNKALKLMAPIYH